MKESLRLSIPTPCTEDWNKMLPVERGRHCQQCCKTVVDFSGMRDAEVLRFFKDWSTAAGSGGVCGRFASDQLRRELAPAPVQRNGWKGWQLLLAGALVFGKGPDNTRPGKAGMELRQVGPGARQSLDRGESSMGQDTSRPLLRDTEVIVDTMATMGTPVKEVGEVVEMPADTVRAEAVNRRYGFTGAVRIIGDTVLCTRKPDDDSTKVIVGGAVAGIAVDTAGALMKGAMDSDAGPVGYGSDAVTVYPNPVMRGGVMRLGWKTEGGQYQVALFSTVGALVQERVIEVAGKGQVDELALSGGLAAGVYFLRVGKAGERVFTTEVLVR
jgi:hypothetical protein